MNLNDDISLFNKIKATLIYIDKNKKKKIIIKDIAAHLNLSEDNCRRLLQKWAGTSADIFFAYLNKDYILNRLKINPLSQVYYHPEGGSPDNLPGLSVTFEALSPHGFKKMRQQNIAISYGFHPTPLGRCFIALTQQGIIELQFVVDDNKMYLKRVEETFNNAGYIKNENITQSIVNKIFSKDTIKNCKPIHLLLHGTNFEIKVWKALLHIPAGSVACYEDIAHYLGSPSSRRAVGNAIAKNNIAYLIPCHRVIKKSGDIGNYRWGTYRKRIILIREFINNAVLKPPV